MTRPRDTFPRDGVIVVLAPEQAAMVAEKDPVLGMHVFTFPGLPEDQALIVDLDCLLEEGDRFDFGV